MRLVVIEQRIDVSQPTVLDYTSDATVYGLLRRVIEQILIQKVAILVELVIIPHERSQHRLLRVRVVRQYLGLAYYLFFLLHFQTPD